MLKNKKIFIVLIILVLIIAFVKIKSELNQEKFQGYTKEQMEERFNKEISDEEWQQMTSSGSVIGGSDGETGIQTESKK